MSDLFLPPIPPSPFPKNQCDVMSDDISGHLSLQRYSMSDVPEADDPTLAWVRSLPSPSGEVFDHMETPAPPQTRFLETPCPVWINCDDKVDDSGGKRVEPSTQVQPQGNLSSTSHGDKAKPRRGSLKDSGVADLFSSGKYTSRFGRHRFIHSKQRFTLTLND